MSKRPYVPWMTRNDERILEYLDSDGTTLSPVTAFGRTDLDVEGQATTVLFRRLPILFAAGLIEEAAHGEYELARKGRAYLAGNLDPGELETPSDAV